MILRTSTFVGALVVLATAHSRLALAQSPQVCAIKIEDPKAGAHVGTSLLVKGTAKGIDTGQYLWILVNPEGVQSWYPQGKGAARIRNGTWSVRAFIGDPGQQQNDEFFLQAVVVDSNTNTQLQKGGELTVQPSVVNGCPVEEVKVIK